MTTVWTIFGAPRLERRRAIAVASISAICASSSAADLSPSALASRQPWLIVHRDMRHLPAIRLAQKWVTEAFAGLPGG